jgi:hypothetical protein
MLNCLAHSIRSKRAILFVGTGVSMSLGLPSWHQLIMHMGEDLGFDPDVFVMPDASFLTIAEYYRLAKGSIGPLRSWMDRNWAVSSDTLRASKVHNQIVDLDFPLVYTTNYDRNLEEIYLLRGKPFVKVANARDVATLDNTSTQIIKFHGDFDDDTSIVLAETDYFDRLAFESPLDIKFRADAFGKTILFIGYSLTDLNIRLLLYRIQKIWQASGFHSDRPQSYVFMARPDPIQERVLGNWGVNALTEDTDDPDDALPTFLAQLMDSVTSL